MHPLPTLHWENHFGTGSHPAVMKHVLSGDHAAHDHDFMEMVIVFGGVGSHSSSRGTMELLKGDSFLIRPGTWHSYIGCDDLELANICFPLAFARSEWRHLLDERARAVLRSGEDLQFTTLPETAVEAFKSAEAIKRGPSGALGLMAWAIDQFAASVPPKASAFHPAVEAAICALEEEPEFPWSVEQLASRVGLDRAYLSRLFTASVGTGPIGYLAMLRAEKAASLLRNSTMNCGEVGIAVGYSDPNHFSRRFRARYGTSPSCYRKSKAKGR